MLLARKSLPRYRFTTFRCQSYTDDAVVLKQLSRVSSWIIIIITKNDRPYYQCNGNSVRLITLCKLLTWM